MLEPQSNVLFFLLMVMFAALAWWMVRTRRLAVRLLAGCLAFLPAMIFGVMAVNKYYGYYSTWSSAMADLTNQGVKAPSQLPKTNLDPGRGRRHPRRQPRLPPAGAAVGVHAPAQRDRPAQSHHPRGVRVPAAAVLPAGLQPVPVPGDRVHPWRAKRAAGTRNQRGRGREPTTFDELTARKQSERAARRRRRTRTGGSGSPWSARTRSAAWGGPDVPGHSKGAKEDRAPVSGSSRSPGPGGAG